MNKQIISVGQNSEIKNIYDAIKLSKSNSKIVLDGGKYFIDKAIELTTEHNGLEITAKEGEEVILTGCKTLENITWTTYPLNSNIKFAFIGKGLDITSLFVNGEAQIIARYPNYDENAPILNGVTDVATIKERSKKWTKVDKGHIRALHQNAWGGNDYNILSKNDENEMGLELQWVGNNNRGGKYMKTALFVENIFEELDSENEWYYNEVTGNLYYYSQCDIPTNHTFEIALNAEIFKICGSDFNNPVCNIKISNVKFQNSGTTIYDTKNNPYIPLLRGDWAVVKAGAIYLENAQQIMINNCEFKNIGSNAIFFYGYNKDSVIENNRFVDIGSSVIQLVGNSNAVDDPSFWQHDLYPDLQLHATTVKNPDLVGPVSENYPRDIVIDNNYMENIGIYEKQSTGVNLSVSSRIKITHNTIGKSCRSNINVNDGSFGGHEIAYNDVFDSQRETKDHGPFNSWGRDRFWSVPEYTANGKYGDIIRNYTNDNVNYYDTALLDAYQTIKIHDNRFHHSADADPTWGIDLDDGSSNYEIYNNLCLGMGIKLREGFNRKVYNNIILDGKIEVHVSYIQANDEVYSNIILNSSPWHYIGVDEERFNKTGYEINKNWYYNFGENIELPNWHDFKNNDNGTILNVDPIFKNPKANDYTVQNSEAMQTIGFKNFSMEQFGKKGEKTCPIYAKLSATSQDEVLLTAEWKGAIISNIDESIISSTASFGKEGAYFKKVDNNSKAYQMGFRERDIVKMINNKAISDIDNFSRFISDLMENGNVEVTVHRENDSFTFTV